MTAPEPEYEYAVEWITRSGNRYVGGSWTLDGAERMIAVRKGDGLFPQPVQILRRPVAEWLPAPTEGESK